MKKSKKPISKTTRKRGIMRKNYSVICCKEYDYDADSFGNPIDDETNDFTWSNDVWLGDDACFDDIADIVLSFAKSNDMSCLLLSLEMSRELFYSRGLVYRCYSYVF